MARLWIYTGAVQVQPVTTTPAGLAVSSSTSPLRPGTYSVAATVVDPNYQDRVQWHDGNQRVFRSLCCHHKLAGSATGIAGATKGTGGSAGQRGPEGVAVDLAGNV